MNNPPLEINGAKVLECAWSGTKPFGVIESISEDPCIEIFGLAICIYENSQSIYRFSCDRNWECEQDSPYGSIEDAKNNIPNQYKNEHAIWRTY